MGWHRSKSLGRLLLGIWLIATGLVPLLGMSSPTLHAAMSLLAVAVGVLLVLDRQDFGDWIP